MSRDGLTKVLFVVGVVVVGGLVYAQSPAQALARSAQDPQLQWGPCPEFMPSGCGLAVLHGDPASANADVFFRLPANTSVVEHWHTSAERMVLVSGELTVKYQGQSPVVLKSGMYAYGPPKRPHSASCGSSGACVLFIAFESAVDAFPGVAPQR